MVDLAEARPPLISFVSPVYGCPESLGELTRRIRATCASNEWSFEIILVDDRCPKGSWEVIEKLVESDRAIEGIRLSRNFGQHPAIQAGLSRARGEWIIVLDCDLQDLPEETPKLFAAAMLGNKVVRAKRAIRRDSLHRRLISWAFYSMLSYLTRTRQSSQIANFGIYHRSVIGTIISWSEQMKYFPAVVEWVGFERTEVDVEHGERFSGKSSYNLARLFQLGLRIVLSFSERPLQLIVALGALISLLSFVISLFVLIGALRGAYDVEGWATTILSVWFLGGITIFVLGICSLYVGRIFAEAKNRPIFIIDEIIKSS